MVNSNSSGSGNTGAHFTVDTTSGSTNSGSGTYTATTKEVAGLEALFTEVDEELKADQQLICDFALGAKAGETKNLKIIDNKLVLKNYPTLRGEIVLARRLSHQVALCISNGATGTWYSMGISWNNSGKLIQQLETDLKRSNYVVVFDENRYYGDNGKLKLMESLRNVIKQFSDSIPIFDKVHGESWGDIQEKDGRQRAILALQEYHERLRVEVELKILRELQEIAGGHHDLAAPLIKAERLKNAKQYLERVDNYLDLLKRIAQGGARGE